MADKTAAEQVSETPQHGEFCWTEIATDDAGACRNFYREVFGWQFEKSAATGAETEYLEFGVSLEKSFGGLFQMNPEWYGDETPAPHMNVYVAVEDVDALASRAFELGGTILGPPMDVPNVGRISQIQDPTGAKFFIIKLHS